MTPMCVYIYMWMSGVYMICDETLVGRVIDIQHVRITWVYIQGYVVVYMLVVEGR